MIRIIEATNRDIKRLMQDVKVDPYGIKIMLPKASAYILKIESLSNISANIVKQEMLSFGGDAAITRGALTGKTKDTACLIIGNLSQILRLEKKLKQQPFGLNKLSEEIRNALDNYNKEKFIVDLGSFRLTLGVNSRIMGIINITPDSFSADGLCKGNKKPDIKEIFDYAQKLVHDGADIIDIGGESTRPGASSLPLKEELERVIPAVKYLSKRIKVPLSVDTYKPEVARQALDNGASIINDITGLSNLSMVKVIARYNAAVIAMHMKGKPSSMQHNPEYNALFFEIIDYLNNNIKHALELGVNKEKVIVDPGIGFGKNLQHNLQLIKHLRELKVLGMPVLLGCSRKSFIGKILDKQPQERLYGTIASCVLAARCGAHILRVHDVGPVKEALEVFDSINKASIQ